jgi:hypothetical protein
MGVVARVKHRSPYATAHFDAITDSPSSGLAGNPVDQFPELNVVDDEHVEWHLFPLQVKPQWFLQRASGRVCPRQRAISGPSQIDVGGAGQVRSISVGRSRHARHDFDDVGHAEPMRAVQSCPWPSAHRGPAGWFCYNHVFVWGPLERHAPPSTEPVELLAGCEGAVSSVVEHRLYTPAVGGSKPSPPTSFRLGKPAHTAKAVAPKRVGG